MAKMRANKRKEGMRPLQVWLLPGERKQVRAYLKRLIAKRKGAHP